MWITSGAFHVQHVTSHMEQEDSSTIKFDRAEIAFIVAVFHGLKPLKVMQKGRKVEYPEKTPHDKTEPSAKM